MRRVKLEPMSCSESELREALDRQVEQLREIPGRLVGGKIAMPTRFDFDD